MIDWDYFRSIDFSFTGISVFYYYLNIALFSFFFLHFFV